MKKRSKTMKRAALVLATILAAPAWLAAQTAVDQKRPAAPDGVVHIENMSGSVKVTGWERAEVQVKGTLGHGAELAFDGTEKRTRVEVEAEYGNPMGIKSDLDVFVPAGSSVSIEGFQATITVAGVTGSVKAETVNGSITHSGAAKDVELQSVNGTIDSTKAGGRVQAEAVNGTVTGGVRFESALSARASLSVESVSGTVDLFLPASFGAEFSVSTFSGEITNELGPAAEKASKWTPQKELSFTVGSGGAHIKVETLSGAVNIRKRS
jgi:DUF4097 and DUF4098 domain-containing protein YvlB